jgi:hypothetical protein
LGTELNTKGAWAIKPQFAEAGNFSEGLAAVKRQRLKQDDEFKYPKFTYPGWGYIDRNGDDVHQAFAGARFVAEKSLAVSASEHVRFVQT